MLFRTGLSPQGSSAPFNSELQAISGPAMRLDVTEVAPALKMCRSRRKHGNARRNVRKSRPREKLEGGRQKLAEFTVQLVLASDRRSFIPDAWRWDDPGTTWARLCLMVKVSSVAPQGISKRPHGLCGLSLHYRARRGWVELLTTLQEQEMLGALRRRAAIGSEPWVSARRSRQLTPRKEAESLHP